MPEIQANPSIATSSTTSSSQSSNAQYGEVTGVTTSNLSMTSSQPPQGASPVTESIPQVLGSKPLQASQSKEIDPIIGRSAHHKAKFQQHTHEQANVPNYEPKAGQNNFNVVGDMDAKIDLTSQGDHRRQPILDILSTVAGVEIGTNKSKPIPQTIHRFWSGGAMSQEAMHVLLDSADKSKGSQFKHSMWYSSALEAELMKRDVLLDEEIDKRDTQRTILRANGYEVCDIDTMFKPDPTQSTFDRLRKKPLPKPEPGVLSKSELNNMVRKACDHLQKGGSDKWDGIKHFSDISRLIYLKEKGGHHFDVDFGLGNMSFEQSYYHNDEKGTVPLMGATTSVSRDRINEHLQVVHPSKPRDLADQSYRDSVVQVAEQAMMMSGMLNGIIATSAQNPNVIEGIELLRPDIANKSGELPSGMLANKSLIGDIPNGSAYTIPPYLIDLEHITAESDSR